jgi:hypothetical protein
MMDEFETAEADLYWETSLALHDAEDHDLPGRSRGADCDHCIERDEDAA